MEIKKKGSFFTPLRKKKEETQVAHRTPSTPTPTPVTPSNPVTPGSNNAPTPTRDLKPSHSARNLTQSSSDPLQAPKNPENRPRKPTFTLFKKTSSEIPTLHPSDKEKKTKENAANNKALPSQSSS